MNGRARRATATRVLTQLRHDPRTIALIVIVPSLLLVLLRYALDRRLRSFDSVGPPLVGIFPLISMFLVTSITMLRERRSGTLERLMTMPLAKFDLLAGYGEAFALVAIVQALVVGVVAFGVLGLTAAHGVALVLALAVLNALLGTALGLFLSAFATTEFQAVQFLPAFVFPQLLLCGLLVPRDQMALPLRAAARVLPMTYAYDALARSATRAPLTGALTLDVLVLAVLMAAGVILGAATLRRRNP